MVHWTCVTQCQSTLLLKREKKLRKMVCGVGRRKKEQSHAQSSDQPFSPLPVFDSYRADAGAWQQQFNSSCHSLFFLFCCPHRLFLKSCCCCISKFSQQSTSMSVSRASCSPPSAFNQVAPFYFLPRNVRPSLSQEQQQQHWLTFKRQLSTDRGPHKRNGCPFSSLLHHLSISSSLFFVLLRLTDKFSRNETINLQLGRQKTTTTTTTMTFSLYHYWESPPLSACDCCCCKCRAPRSFLVHRRW